MRTLWLTAMFIVALSSNHVCAQNKLSDTTPSSVRLKKNEPNVYIKLDRVGRRKPLRTGESDEGIWLRLHNNSKWSLFFPVFNVPDEYGDAGMYYDVEYIPKPETNYDPLSIGQGQSEQSNTAIPSVPSGYQIIHTSSTIELPSGDSILFSIPREHLRNRLHIRIKFNYEWEDSSDVFAGREPIHYVTFNSYQLERSIKQSER